MKTYNIKLEMEVEIQVEDDVTLEQAEEIVRFEKECTSAISSKLNDKCSDIEVVDFKVVR